MKIRLEKPVLNNFKDYGWQKQKTKTGDFDLKNFSYTYNLFKGNHSMEGKIIQYGIIFLDKYKIAQTTVAQR